MTNERAIELFKEVKAECEAKQTELSKQIFEHEGIEALDMAIKALETESKPCEYMFWRIYNYINDKRLAVSPDEITPPEQRAERQVKADLLGELLDVMNDMLVPEMKCGDE